MIKKITLRRLIKKGFVQTKDFDESIYHCDIDDNLYVEYFKDAKTFKIVIDSIIEIPFQVDNMKYLKKLLDVLSAKETSNFYLKMLNGILLND
jgi:hypothetical protein